VRVEPSTNVLPLIAYLHSKASRRNSALSAVGAIGLVRKTPFPANTAAPRPNAAFRFSFTPSAAGATP